MAMKKYDLTSRKNAKDIAAELRANQVLIGSMCPNIVKFEKVFNLRVT